MCRSECAIKAKADKLMYILKAFAYCGCICTPVSDPLHRHHSKRACVETRAKKVLQDVNTTSARCELASYSSRYPLYGVEMSKNVHFTRVRELGLRRHM